MANSSNARLCSRFSVLALGLVSLFVPLRQAEAAPEFGGPGTFAIGVEDITGYYARQLKFWDRTDRTVELSRSNLSLGFATGGVRLGVHYFLIPGLSLGGTVGYESNSASNTYQDNPGTWTTDIPTNTRIVIAPKVGYALMFTDKVGLWFRGGLGYERYKQRNAEGGGQGYSRDSFLMASADILFVWSPVPHFGLLIGPVFENSLTGSHFEHSEQDGDYSNDARLRRLGITTGLVGYF